MREESKSPNAQNSNVIRIIGDPVLHTAATLFPEHPTQKQLQTLKQQIQIAKTALIKTGGGGIAANQCAAIDKPYQLIIVGVFNNIEEHASKVSSRYPNVKFPDAIIMINPVVIQSSKETITFYHGCLSVPAQIRAAIQTPKKITATFLTLDDNDCLVKNTLTATDMEAIALQHELNHILYGKTYIDCCLRELSLERKRSSKYTASKFTQQQYYRQLIAKAAKQRIVQ